MIKVLLVDDHELVRTAIEALLNTFPEISVVGLADCGEQALLLTEQFSPDVILMDIKMPGIGGEEASRRILDAHPNIKIIALSGEENGLIPMQLMQLGARGFLSKNSPVNEMVAAISKVMSGEIYLSEEISHHLSEQNIETSEKNPFALLSKREAEVAHFILEGHSIQKIAEILSLDHRTISTYRTRLYKELKIKTDVELTLLAAKWNYFEF